MCTEKEGGTEEQRNINIKELDENRISWGNLWPNWDSVTYITVNCLIWNIRRGRSRNRHKCPRPRRGRPHRGRGVGIGTSFQGHACPCADIMSSMGTSSTRTSPSWTSSWGTLCPHRDILPRTSCPCADIMSSTGTSPSRTSSAGILCPQRGRPQRGHYVLNGDVPVAEILDRYVLGRDIMSAQGRPQRGHLCPFLLLPLCMNIMCGGHTELLC